jgi:2-polyprenyl-6-methoxyphenol hydroxylase-like FAD-dependent oxidoreductase
MSTDQETTVDVLIQGAGIGGLTLAIALMRKGYTVRIVERAHGLSEIGAGIWMAANPMQIFDRLDFAEKITSAGWPIHRITLQGDNGDILKASDLSAVSKLFGFETVALHRSVLQGVLFEQLPSDVVTFGMEVTSLAQNTDSVSVLLTNSSRVNAKIVVGADGIHSQIRKLAALDGKTQGAETRYSGSSSYRAIARSTNLLSPELDHDAYEIWSKGCRLGFSKINADDYYWYMTFDIDPGKSVSPIARRAHAESLFRKFFPKWTPLLENTQPDGILQTDISDLKRLHTWSSARIGLIGDAAHATTPNLGQGGAMAVEDAYSLADAVERSGLNGKAFEHYEKQRREKVDWTVSSSWNIGRMCHLKNPVLRGLRNAVLRKMLSSGGEKQIKKLYSVG